MINNFSKILGERLLSITEVSEATGISRATLTAIYYRRTNGIKFSTVANLCEYLQVPLSDLFEYVPEESEGGEKHGRADA